MTKQVIRGTGEGLKVPSGISQQRLKVSAMMIVCHDSARDTPEPLDAVSIRVIGRRVDQRQLVREFGQHPTHEEGAKGRVSLEVVRNDDRHTSERLRTGHSRPHLITKDISRPSRSNPAIKSLIPVGRGTQAPELFLSLPWPPPDASAHTRRAVRWRCVARQSIAPHAPGRLVVQAERRACSGGDLMAYGSFR